MNLFASLVVRNLISLHPLPGKRWGFRAPNAIRQTSHEWFRAPVDLPQVAGLRLPRWKATVNLVQMMVMAIADSEMNMQPQAQLDKHSSSTDRHFISALEIQHRISELSSKINDDFGGQDLVVIAVLKGAFMFASDLVRRLQKLGVKVEIDFIIASSKISESDSFGNVIIDLDITTSIADRNVLLLDDIIDTGATFSFIYDHLKMKSPKLLSTCVLLDKPQRRKISFNVDYIGFEIPDLFVIGYGLDYKERHRCLPYISFIE